MYRHLELLTWYSKLINTSMNGLRMIYLEKLLYRKLQRKLHSREKALLTLCTVSPYYSHTRGLMRRSTEGKRFEAVSIIVDTCSSDVIPEVVRGRICLHRFTTGRVDPLTDCTRLIFRKLKRKYEERRMFLG